MDEYCDDIICGEVQLVEIVLSRYMYCILKYLVFMCVIRFVKIEENV